MNKRTVVAIVKNSQWTDGTVALFEGVLRQGKFDQIGHTPNGIGGQTNSCHDNHGDIASDHGVGVKTQ